MQRSDVQNEPKTAKSLKLELSPLSQSQTGISIETATSSDPKTKLSEINKPEMTSHEEQIIETVWQDFKLNELNDYVS